MASEPNRGYPSLGPDGIKAWLQLGCESAVVSRHDHSDLKALVGNAAHRELRQAARDLAIRQGRDDEAMAELLAFESPSGTTESEPRVIK